MKNTQKDFWAKVNKTKKCWNWKGKIDKQTKYGYFSFEGKGMTAHRHSYLFTYGYIKKGLVIDHLCRNRSCVNPKHLEAVTTKVNILRGIGLTAINAQKTHCMRGHLFDKKNTRIIKNGRSCRLCSNAIQLKYGKQNKELVNKAKKDWRDKNKKHIAEYGKKYKKEHKLLVLTLLSTPNQEL